jgi:excisionase family DNA binding protein
MPGEITTAEAATRLGVTQQHVRWLIAENKLKARKFNNDWALETAEVERYASIRKLGRPRRGPKPKNSTQEPQK